MVKQLTEVDKWYQLHINIAFPPLTLKKSCLSWLITSQHSLWSQLKIYINIYFKKREKKWEKQAQRRATVGRSQHKSHGVIQHQESYFPTRCPKWIFINLIVLVEKKYTKLIYHMPWLYQYPPLPFHRSYKN